MQPVEVQFFIYYFLYNKCEQFDFDVVKWMGTYVNIIHIFHNVLHIRQDDTERIQIVFPII